MKKIGFVDYYISEWHSNNYPAWMAECELSKDYKIAYAWAELDTSPEDGVTTAEWCEKNGAEKCDTIEELCEKSDVIVILAPSDPDKHLGYASKALKYGKPTYIDKTFAPDLHTANAIKAMADEYGTPFFSTSALRYASELETEFDCKEIMVTGSGASIEEYIIHQIEMVVVKLGLGAKRICAQLDGSKTLFFVEYEDDRRATMLFAPSMPFTLYMSTEGTKPVYRKADSPYFQCLMEDIVRFFDSKDVSFSYDETAEVMKIREGAVLAAANVGAWIDLSELKK